MSWTKSPEARAFLIHAAAWAVICAGLAALNLTMTPPEGQPVKYWFQWPLFGWGIGVAAHGLGLWMQNRRSHSPLLATEERRGFWVHLFTYVTVCALLVWVDLATSPGLNWVYWPILGWGAGVIAHGYGVWRHYKPEPARKPQQTAASSGRKSSAKSAPAKKKSSAKAKKSAPRKSSRSSGGRSARGPRSR